MFRRKKLLVVIAAAALAIIASIFLLLRTDDNRIRVEVIAIPEDSAITLNGEPVRAGRINLEHGEHTFTASREHFDDATVIIHTDYINSNEPIYLLPAPNSPEAFELLDSNPGIQERREEARGMLFAQEQRTMSARYPILADLPVTDQTFKIDYGASKQRPENPTMIGVYIHAIDQQGRDDALNWMRTFGYNPEDYEIIYINPLEEN